jgi:hypothetical protein
MSVRIKPIIDHKCYEVNGDTVFKDENGFWKNKDNLSFQEIVAFVQYLITVISNPQFKKHTQAEYRSL